MARSLNKPFARTIIARNSRYCAISLSVIKVRQTSRRSVERSRWMSPAVRLT